MRTSWIGYRGSRLAVMLVGALGATHPGPWAGAAFSAGTANATSYFEAAIVRYHLKTDGPGDRVSTPVLPLSPDAPTATALPNYDTERDGEPGLVLAKTEAGLEETDPEKFQVWSWPASSPVALSGPVRLRLWSAMKDFDTTKRGAVTAGLYDCDAAGADCGLVASATESKTPWSGGSATWVEKTWDFGTVSHTVAAGRSLRAKVVVEASSADDMWFAYDTTAYASRLEVG